MVKEDALNLLVTLTIRNATNLDSCAKYSGKYASSQVVPYFLTTMYSFELLYHVCRSNI